LANRDRADERFPCPPNQAHAIPVAREPVFGELLRSPDPDHLV